MVDFKSKPVPMPQLKIENKAVPMPKLKIKNTAIPMPEFPLRRKEMSNGLSKADMATKALAKKLEQIKTTKNRNPKEIDKALIEAGLQQMALSYSPGDDDSSPELDRKALEKNIENNLKRWNKVKVR